MVMVVALAAIAVCAPAQARAAEVLSPLAMRIIAPPQPVLGADGRMHLAYELKVPNQSPSFVTIKFVQAYGPGGRVGTRVSGARLDDLLRLDGGRAP